MIIGYARVSTTDQNCDYQIDELTKSGCEKIFIEKASAKTKDRPELTRLLDSLRQDDIVVVYKLDRLGRSLKDLITLLEMFKSNGVQFKSLSENIDTTTSTGKLVFNVIGAIAEFERDIIVERTKAGLKAARARGRKGGRKQKLTDKQIKLAKLMLQDPSVQKSDVAKHFNISRPTLNRYLDAAPDLEQESLFK
ncbi:recombinase family protein [Escherichia coli]|uniref:recombinase family protein n=1 Tax=Gammaproteobacteria TaxID=1236 RepID=UPI000B7DBFEE|nr:MULTISPECIES: recombinase family protein [Gammaproteobacteria]EFC5153513.1 recombinase family protein [Escherichia coli]EFC5167277.1 recombinase family protein [Escherichia coli]EFH1615538.1 recombinase family protein [Escherichia coli]EFT7141332.1 recombinase family protein [Escherichia coli]EGL7834492.1 recombinase family protein [Escherichia coli]